jgi:SWI/SNF-related matrix-associated actin-dependent regulator 1 of chromatin subfamily A
MPIHPDLFPYQVEGAEWMADHWSPNVLLGDGMGLGKTIISIAGSDLVCARNILVLCPGIARVNWAREFQKWQTRKRTVGIVTGSNDVPVRDVVIASYSVIVKRKALVKLLSRQWDLLICDEAHALKENNSLRAKAVYGNRCDRAKGLSAQSKRTWLLTGTPIPNHLGEMWTHCRALFPEASAGLERRTHWLDHFCDTIETEYGTRILRSKNLDDFVQRIKPYTLRRKFEDIFKDMPPLRLSQVIVHPDKLPPRPEGLAETEKIIRAALIKSEGAMTDEAKAILKSIKGEHIATLRKWTGIAKAPAVAEILRHDFSDGMDKCVVFARHTDVIDILRKNLPHPAVIDGRTPMKDRDGIIDNFQGRKAAQRIDALIVHIDIASTALTLTAANQVAFAETEWVPKDVQQALARCYRIGQTRPVMGRIFSLQGSTDEHLGAALVRKTKITSAVENALSA